MDFDTILSSGETGLAAMVQASQPETLQLEFKAQAPGPHGQAWIKGNKLTDDIRRVLAKAMSGMANSAGGVLVLGVEGRKDPNTGIDGAVALVPFGDVALMGSLVTQGAADLLQPRHDGIRVTTIPSSEGTASGFVIVDVPRSERRPHRSEAKDQKQYFKRAAGATFAMEHYDIEDAFRRYQSADLTLTHLLQRGMTARSSGASIHHMQVVLSLTNRSGATAKFPSLLLLGVQGSYLASNKYRDSKQQRLVEGMDVRISADAGFVVHPDETREFERLSLDVAVLNNREVYFVDDEKRLSAFVDFEVPFRVYADNSRMREGTVSFTARQVLVALGLQEP